MYSWLLFLMLVACGDGSRKHDTIFTGFSGVLIFGILAYILYRVVKSRTGGS